MFDSSRSRIMLKLHTMESWSSIVVWHQLHLVFMSENYVLSTKAFHTFYVWKNFRRTLYSILRTPIEHVEYLCSNVDNRQFNNQLVVIAPTFICVFIFNKMSKVDFSSTFLILYRVQRVCCIVVICVTACIAIWSKI